MASPAVGNGVARTPTFEVSDEVYSRRELDDIVAATLSNHSKEREAIGRQERQELEKRTSLMFSDVLEIAKQEQADELEQMRKKAAKAQDELAHVRKQLELTRMEAAKARRERDGALDELARVRPQLEALLLEKKNREGACANPS